MLSLAKENIKKYQRSQRNELLLTLGYRFAEAIIAVALFAFGYLYFSIL